jgi:type II secretory pathway component PulF
MIKTLRSIAIFSLTMLPYVAFAQYSTYLNPIKLMLTNGTEVTTIPQLLLALVDGFVALMAPVIVAFIIYAGFLFVTAAGEPAKIEKARFVLTWTLIGAAVLLGAKVMEVAVQTTVESFK